MLKKIDEASANSITSALGFFETPPSNVGISSSTYRELLTLNPVSDPPYLFKIHPGSNFLDLSHIFLETEMKIERKETGGQWERLKTDDKIGTIQAIGATWIKNLRVTINGRETFNANSLYSYKSYLDLELSYATDVKANYLGAVGYHPPGRTVNQDSHEDEGFKRRKELFASGKTAQFYTKLNADIFSSDLYLINSVPIEVEIHPSSSEFLLLLLDPAPTGGTASPVVDYRLVITSVKMYVKTIELMDGIAMDIANQLERAPARYPIRRSELKSVFISAGRREMQTNLFTEQIPRRIVVAMVGASAYNGVLNKSPFNFGHYNVREITITTGTTNTPSVLYDLDYKNDRFMRAYHDMQEGVGLANTIETNGISPHHFKNGWAIYVFTLTSDLENSSGFELIKSGTTSIYVKFADIVPSGGINMIVYGEMDSLLMLDKNRTLSSDQTI